MKQFPIVRAEGSHYEVGRAVGETMRERIVGLFTKNKTIHPDYFARFERNARDLLNLTKQYFPQYVDELQGLADGAGLTVEQLFLSNACEVGYFIDPEMADHCTIIGVPKRGAYIVGHNEDWEVEALEHLYILDAVIEGVRIFGLGYDFTNTIIGDSVAINQFGLMQAINDVSHHDTQTGVPRGFVARAVLDRTTLEEAEKLIQTIPRRSGFNHFLVQGERLWNIESSAKEHVVEKVVLDRYAHTNHYLTDLKRIEKGNPESEKRYAKVKERLDEVHSVDDIKRLLSDRTEPRICRNDTIGSVVFDVPNKVAHIAYGQPTPESYVEYSLAHVVG